MLTSFNHWKNREMEYLLLATAVSILFFTRAENDDCRPMPPFLKGERNVNPRVCCRLDSLLPEVIDSNFRMCVQKFTTSNNTNNEAQMGMDYKSTTIPTSKGELACLGECVFNESRLMTADREINKEAVLKLYNGAVASNKDAAPVMTAALIKCFDVYQDMIDEEVDCTSGAEELRKCITRQIFLNCPEGNWNANKPTPEDPSKKSHVQ